jgi:hypothetical protein
MSTPAANAASAAQAASTALPDPSLLGQHPIEHWMMALAVGALLGALGQLVRTIPGTYKRHQAGGGEPFSGQVLLLTVVIGAVAGMLAALFVVGDLVAPKVGFGPLLGLMAAGYAGADFIEGFAGRWLRQGTPAATPAASKPDPDPNQPDDRGAVG